MSNNSELQKLINEIEETKQRLHELEMRKLELEDPSIESLGLSTRATKALLMKGIERVSQLVNYMKDDPELETIRNIGKVTGAEVIARLQHD